LGSSEKILSTLTTNMEGCSDKIYFSTPNRYAFGVKKANFLL